MRGGGTGRDGGLSNGDMKISDWLLFFFSLPRYSVSLVLATMGVKKVGPRMFWSNMFMAVLLILALLKFGLHAFNCPSRTDAIDFRVYSRRKMAEGGDLQAVQRSNPPGHQGLLGHPTMTVFCAPKAFERDNPNDPQRRALLSWLKLKPRPKIVLMGNEPTMAEIAKEFPQGWITVEENLDYNMKGMPMFHSMMARARAADTNVSMMINGDIVLLEDFMVALRKTMVTFDDWLLTAMRWDVKELPYRFEHKGSGVVQLVKTSTGQAVSDTEVAEFGRAQGTLHTYGGVDFWAWNVRRFDGGQDLPLHSTAMPPFTFGRGRYDNWLTHMIVEEASRTGRSVVDASDAIVNIHVAHSYAHVGTGAGSALVNFWSSNKKNSWEAFSNIHLSQTVGNFRNQQGTALHIPFKMVSCPAEASAYGSLCLTRRVKPASCTCEYSAAVNNTQTEPLLEASLGKYRCGSLSVDQPFQVQAIPTNSSVPGLPHTLDQLLPEIADENRTVVLLAVTSIYKEFAFNYVCHAVRLGISNLLIAALDAPMYRYAFTQGLPVYLENSPGVGRAKSRAVLRVLRAGFNVLWTDVDVVLLRNPLPELWRIHAAAAVASSASPSSSQPVLPILSNEPNASRPGNGLRRVNPGFYLARADAATIQALAAVVSYADSAGVTDQVALYNVLCGAKGEKRVGSERCRYDNGLVVEFLDRRRFPNGAVNGLWEAANSTAAADVAAVLHNNWVAGKHDKVDRLVRNALWIFDPAARMCVHPWHPWNVQRASSMDDYKAAVMQTLIDTGTLREYAHQ